MKQTICALILIPGLLSGCYQCKPTRDPNELRQVFESYFHSIETKDYDKLTAATTDDFVLYEMGRVWNNDSVIHNIESNLPFEVRYTFHDLKIYTDHLSGDITCSNHGEFVFGDSTKQSFDWIESATFRIVNGKWKMNFLHITERFKRDEL